MCNFTDMVLVDIVKVDRKVCSFSKDGDGTVANSIVVYVKRVFFLSLLMLDKYYANFQFQFPFDFSYPRLY